MKFFSHRNNCIWYDNLYESVRAISPSSEVLRHLIVERERIIYTTNFLRKFELKGKSICEMGGGGIGLACAQEIGAEVEVYDVNQWFRPILDNFYIPWNFIDLHQPGLTLQRSYDVILLCEVIEHIARWPAEILTELKKFLNLGGMLLVTTQNLNRLSNRLRMVAGKRLFANFVPEELVMAHLREYTPEEIEFLFQRAEFSDVQWKLASFPDIRSPQIIKTGYNLACKLFPRLSNIIFCWASTGR